MKSEELCSEETHKHAILSGWQECPFCSKRLEIVVKKEEKKPCNAPDGPTGYLSSSLEPITDH